MAKLKKISTNFYNAIIIYNNAKTNQNFDNNRKIDAESNGYAIPFFIFIKDNDAAKKIRDRIQKGDVMESKKKMFKVSTGKLTK